MLAYKWSVILTSFNLMIPMLYVSCFISCVLGTSRFSDGVEDILGFVQDALGSIQNYVGEPHGCKYTCPDGTKPKKNPKHKSSSNGCGAFGIQLHLSNKMTECCDEHDICYDTCNEPKDFCDKAFKKCLEKFCHKGKKAVTKDEYEACRSAVDIMYAGTVTLGCKPYKDAQKNACLCGPKWKQRNEL